MIIDIILALILVLAFKSFGYILGNILRSIFHNTFAKRSKIADYFIGIYTLTCISYFFVFLNISLTLINLIILLAICWYVWSLRHFCLNLKDILKKYSLGIISIFFIAFLINPNPIDPALSFRNGPDLVGWTLSADYFCTENSLEPLRSRILLATGAQNFEQTMSFPAGTNDKFLYKIPSFTNQIQAEFLLGAHRIGLPSLIGSNCRVLGLDNLSHLIAAYQIALFLILFIIGRQFSDRTFKSGALSQLLPLILVFNCCLLATTFEGGLGQLFSIGFISFLLLAYSLQKEPKAILIPGVTSVSFGLLTYFDGAVFAFLILLYLHLVLAKKYKFGFWLTMKAFSKIISTVILLSFPALLFTKQLFLERFSGQPSGWPMGRFALLADACGLLNWLPDDSVTILENSFYTLSLSFILSIYIIYFFLKYSINSELLLLMLIIYSFTICQVYFLQEPFNNYLLFKMSAYFSCMFLFLFQLKFPLDNHIKTESQNRISNLMQISTYGIVLLILLGGMLWSAGWVKNRQYSLDVESIQLLAPKFKNFDIHAYGFEGAGYAKLALLGDLHYLNESRGYQVETNPSVPKRPVLYVIPTKIGKNSENFTFTNSKSEVFKLRLWKKNDVISLYLNEK